MGFLGDIEEIEQYLTIWEKVRNLDKLNIKVLIDHKIKLLGEYTQDRNTTLAESIVEVVKLKDLLSATRFAPDSVETLISKMVQDSMLRNGLEVVEEPELVFYGKISRLHEVVSVEVDGVAVVPETEVKKYLVLHSYRPFRCDLVREQDADEYLHGVQNLDKGPPWSGFFYVLVDQVNWTKTEPKVEVILKSSGKEKALLLRFRDVKVAKGWVSNLKKINKEYKSNHSDNPGHYEASVNPVTYG